MDLKERPFLKKLICVFMVLVCLCSCNKNEIRPHLLGISFAAELMYFNEVYSFDGEILNDGTLIAVMKEPKELEELKLTVKPDGIEADYKGLKYTANEATMPFSGIVKEVYASLNSLMGKESLIADDNGEISAKVGQTDYLLTLSPTGLPQRIELPGKHISLNFYNVSITKEE